MAGRISTVSISVDNHHDRTKEETTDFEKAMEICGNGKYQYIFLLVCGIMFLCVGLQYGINAYILPTAECDLGMRSEEKGFLNVAFLSGSVISALFWGVIAGAYGRRNIILTTLFADSIVTILASFMQSYKLFLLFRMINGFLIGASASLIYSYFGEFHSEKHRAKSICFLGFFIPLAWLLLPALAWIIIPLPISFEFYGIRYNSWRLLLGMIGVPSFIISAITLMYPESPKFMVSQGKTEKALAVLQEIYAVNTGRDKSEFPIKQLFSEAVFDKNKAQSSNALTELLKNIWWQLRTIGSPHLLKYAILFWTIYTSNMFGYYGMGYWLPELFNRFENYQQSHPNASMAVCELIYDMQSNLMNQTHLQEPFIDLMDGVITECKINIDKRVFINSLTTNAVCLIGSVTSGYLSRRVGRRTIPVTGMLIAGIAVFSLYFANSSAQILIVVCIFSLMITTTNFVITAGAVDVFPTHVSAAAVCMMISLGRLGAMASNLTFGMLLDINCEVPIFLMAGIVIFGGLLSFLIPSREKK